MVTAVSSTPKPRPTTKRPPLLPSATDNAPPPRRPKAREVTSRYLSSSSSSTNTTSSSSSTSLTTTTTSGSPSISSRRSPSPIATPKCTPHRAASAERRRPAAATPSTAEKTLVTSMRSLSVSFQGESYSLPVSKAKPSPSAAVTPAAVRRVTPERRRAGVTTPVRERENSRPPIEQQQHRWPGRLRGDNSNFLTRSLDYGAERPKLSRSVSVNLKDLIKSNEEARGISELNSDVESVSSETSLSRNAPRSVVVRKVVHPASPSPNSPSCRPLNPSKLTYAKKFPNDSPVSSPQELCPPRGLSPLRGSVRAASPSRALTSSTGSLVRGIASPSRARVSTGNSMNESNMCSTPSILSFAADVRRGKLGDNRIADAHDLRLLYNRLLQWRLANARVENTLLVQKHTAERSLYNAWVTTSKLRHSVRSKGTELQLLRHNLKLYSIFKEQEPHLESWGLFEREHCNSVTGAIKALEASTLRLPIVCGARADVHKVQEAITSAVDVMQAMASSVCSLLVKVEQMNLLVSELSKLSAREHRSLDECKDLFSKTFIPLQVMQCSLRTQILQVGRVQARLGKKV